MRALEFVNDPDVQPLIFDPLREIAVAQFLSIHIEEGWEPMCAPL